MKNWKLGKREGLWVREVGVNEGRKG